MGEFVTYEEFAELKKEVVSLREQQGNDREWRAKYGERIDTIYKLVEDMSSKPQKRWDAVIAAIISAVVVAVISVFIKK